MTGKTWQREVQLRDLLNTEDLSDANVKRIGKVMAQRVSAAVPETDALRDSRLNKIIKTLDNVSGVSELNVVLDRLYNWGDQDHRLWVTL